MKHITFEQAEIDCKKCGYAFAAAGTKENPINWGDATGFYLEGYNTAVDLANAEIQALNNHHQELGNKQDEYVKKCYNTINNLNEKLRTVADKSYQYGFNDMAMSASEQIKQLTKERDMYHDVLMAYEEPPKLSPEMKDLLSKPSVTLADLLNPLRERIEKLEQRIITDEQAQDTLYCDIKELRELLTATIDTEQDKRQQVLNGITDIRLAELEEAQKLIIDEQTANLNAFNMMGRVVSDLQKLLKKKP